MKNKFLCLLVLFAGIMFFTKCKKTHLVTVNNRSVALHDCTEMSIEPYICFDSLLTDSRCPTGAECFWQGTALIKISFHEKGNVHKFIMSLKHYPGLGYPSDTTIDGYNLIFTDLKSYPDINTPSPQTKETEAFFSLSN